MASQETQQPTVAEEQIDAGSAEQMDTSIAAPDAADMEEHSQGIEFILDLPLRVSVELGRTRMVVNDLLQLAQGSIIELDKLAGEPLEVLVNDKMIARGEVVSVNDKFGIRVTDIISPTERIEKLG
jgi:flagellar motor switch protein FliN/FliY